jgi:hypothetical protein
MRGPVAVDPRVMASEAVDVGCTPWWAASPPTKTNEERKPVAKLDETASPPPTRSGEPHDD